ncbi:adenylate kinase [Thioclava sp. SK-1]|uniref:adenylate kinase n=1 Tax=Thioclava sp. SK-1 TaxID=1889770 RepID=UPI0008270581|nr:adenylate kinase [Thioclava sp. SK-1]OCX66084.1 adenylate kinase [Thioclava sp. SK-1]
MAYRIYITGAAGSGTSCLGAGLATHLGVAHLDTDDFYWAQSPMPYTEKRPVPLRCALIDQAQHEAMGYGGWVLSGSADGWGDSVIRDADLIVFMRAPTPLRLMRIRRREAAKFGSRIESGGDMELNHRKFLKWAASYDEPYFGGRSLTRHLEWLSGQDTPVLELSGTRPLSELIDHSLFALRGGAAEQGQKAG